MLNASTRSVFHVALVVFAAVATTDQANRASAADDAMRCAR